MQNDEFTKLFKYMQEHLTAIESKLDQTATRDQVDRVMSAVDKIAAGFGDQRDEQAATNAQLDRHEAWIHELADTTGTKLSRP